MFHLKRYRLSSGLFIIWVHSLIILTCNDEKEAKHTFKFMILKIMIMKVICSRLAPTSEETGCLLRILTNMLQPSHSEWADIYRNPSSKWGKNMLSSSCLLLSTSQRIHRWSHSLLFSSICWYLTGINNAEVNWIDASSLDRMLNMKDLVSDFLLHTVSELSVVARYYSVGARQFMKGLHGKAKR